MLKKTIKYVDFDGNSREEDFYFNLSRAEVTEMELSLDGGLIKHIQRIVSLQDNPKLFELFKTLILGSFGEKSPDGKYFHKSLEIRKKFEESEAYSEFLMELVGSEDPAKAVAQFVEGILPKAK